MSTDIVTEFCIRTEVSSDFVDERSPPNNVPRQSDILSGTLDMVWYALVVSKFRVRRTVPGAQHYEAYSGETRFRRVYVAAARSGHFYPYLRVCAMTTTTTMVTVKEVTRFGRCLPLVHDAQRNYQRYT